MSSQQQQQQQQPHSVANRRSLNGLVTKLVSDGAYGFINDEIFFPQTNVSGGPASIGDQVYAECEYSANLPIKWNATSVKVLQKAMTGGSSVQSQSSADSLMRQASQQQDVMSQQQQQQPQPFANLGPPVAVTYQQHRQQRHQRQFMEQQQQSQPEKPQTIDSQVRSSEQQGMSPSGYFGNAAERTFNQQQQSEISIQPFHGQPPMGPPNFAFTSQPGSAFVQGHQFPLQTPFINQQQQSQQQTSSIVEPQQHLLPNYSMLNQRNNNHQQNKNMSGPSRFNNQNDKNDRQMNRRNINNRNEGKFESRNRGNDQDQGGNNNSGGRNKGRNSRDRSIGRGSRRNSPPAEASPAPNSSARSTTSINSDRCIKSRRHYEVQNIPKSQILTNLNSANMKQRCPSSLHVPSDLKEVIINRNFRFDLKNIPKPLKFSFDKTKSKTTSDSKGEPSNPDEQQSESEQEGKEESSKCVMPTDPKGSDVSDTETKPTKQQATLASAKSDTRLNHKYGVKVLLISLPEMDSIYKSVLASDQESASSSSEVKNSLKLDETISLLCSRGLNNGNSLVGGKFDPTLDGFIEGSYNKFERHGLHPNLISTSKRVVLEQTGLDLGDCQSWTLVSTFIYNNKSDYFSSKASIEYSFIYMPHIWTVYNDIFDRELMKTIDSERDNQNTQTIVHDQEQATEIETKGVLMKQEASQDIEVHNQKNNQSEEVAMSEAAGLIKEEPVHQALNPDTLSELKVADLKVELDKRNVKYKGLPKKAELVAMLRESILSEQNGQEEVTKESHSEAQVIEAKEDNQTAVESDQVVEDEQKDGDKVVELGAEDKIASSLTSSESLKRKTPEHNNEDNQELPCSKKTCLGEDTKSLSVEKKRVDLIKGSFSVYSKNDQCSLSLVNLKEAAQAGRHDQFELSVSSSILKESLIQHLSEYILTVLVEDYRSRVTSKNTTTGSSDGNISASSSQETTSDTNNNMNNSSKNLSSSFKNPPGHKEPARTREYPSDRYINLAMSYFEVSQMGYLQFDDLSKLFNNTSLTVSKRALLSIVGEGEKLNYKTLPDLSPKLEPAYIYRYPEQFSMLPGSHSDITPNNSLSTVSLKSVEFEGVSYDVEKLIQQAKEAETMRVNLVDRFNYAIENSDKQAEEIHVLEVSQKSLARAIKAQNDEICDLKRERDLIKKKYEALKKGINESISSLSDLAKDDK